MWLRVARNHKTHKRTANPRGRLGYGQSVQACGVEFPEPFLALFATVLQELWSDVVWPLGFPTLQLADGSGELSSGKGC